MRFDLKSSAKGRTNFLIASSRSISLLKFFAALVVALGLNIPTAVYGIDPKVLETMIGSGETDAALDLIDAEIASSTSDPVDLLFARARVIDATGNAKKAEHAYRELIRRYPARPEPYNNLARIYSAQGKLDQASSLLRAGLYTDPTYRMIFDNLTRIYTEQAARSLSMALDPNDPKSDPSQPFETLNEIPTLSN